MTTQTKVEDSPSTIEPKTSESTKTEDPTHEETFDLNYEDDEDDDFDNDFYDDMEKDNFPADGNRLSKKKEIQNSEDSLNFFSRLQLVRIHH
jgi:hypothetical protein